MKAPTLQMRFVYGVIFTATICGFASSAYSQSVPVSESRDGQVDVQTSALLTDEASVEESVSILFLSHSKLDPSVSDVDTELTEDMGILGIRIRVDQVSMLPETQEQWVALAESKVQGVPGILAVVSWSCAAENGCSLYVVESSTLTFVSIPIGAEGARDRHSASPDSDSPESAMIVAAGIRSMLHGELFSSLASISRLEDPPNEAARDRSQVDHAEKTNTDTYQEIEVDAFSPPSTDRSGRRLWLEAGYLGDYPYPASRTIHGVLLGTTVYLHEHFALALRVGGLARRKDTGINGVMYAYNMPVALLLKIPIHVGPAMFTIAPVVQLDVIWARAQTVRGETLDAYYSDFSFGGETTWSIAMPRAGVELFFGAGVLATMFSESYPIYHEQIMYDTRIQFYWLAGVSKNIFGK